jgi:DNA sulfur modification protein DndB
MESTEMISFPALRGKMGNREFYVAMFRLRLIPRLFKFPDHDELPPEQRAQRILNMKRVPEIARYILEHEDGWVFSSLTASFMGEEQFIAVDGNPNIGVLSMPLDTDFLINDGQHRRAAIEEALRINPRLGNETISVVLFPDEDLERSQQMFSDLNRTVQKTSRSLDILYDQRDIMNQITLSVGEGVNVFRGRVEKDKVSLAARSPRFTTLSALYDANAALLGRIPETTPDEIVTAKEETAIEYWKAVTANIPEWQEVADGTMKPSEARQSYVSTATVTLGALGAVGKTLLREYPDTKDWKEVLTNLSNIDWRRTNREWQGICMIGTDIVTRRQTREATAHFIEWKLGLRDERPLEVFTE